MALCWRIFTQKKNSCSTHSSRNYVYIFIELTNWREMLSNRYVAVVVECCLMPPLHIFPFMIIFIHVSRIIKTLSHLFFMLGFWNAAVLHLNEEHIYTHSQQRLVMAFCTVFTLKSWWRSHYEQCSQCEPLIGFELFKLKKLALLHIFRMIISIQAAVCVNRFAFFHTISLPVDDDSLCLICLRRRWRLSIARWVTTFPDCFYKAIGWFFVLAFCLDGRMKVMNY
jgi:hypothetical protein